MLKIQNTLKNFKEFSQKTGWFFVDCFGFVRSLFMFFGFKRPKIFYGYNHYNFACLYARNRDRRWKARWDQLGKIQGVLPVKEKLLVCSRLEIKIYQKLGILPKKFSYNKIFKNANYFKSKNDYGNK